MKVVKEEDMLPNHGNPTQEAAQDWFAQAMKMLVDNPGEWVEVSNDYRFHVDPLHKEKFELLNKASGLYDVVFRYPEGAVCVMYARLPVSNVKRFKKSLVKL